MSFWMVESPRYLLTQGRVEEAQAVLEHVARVNRVKLPPGQLAPVLRGAAQDAETGGQEHAPLLAAAAPLPAAAAVAAAGQGGRTPGKDPYGPTASDGVQQLQDTINHQGVDGVVVASSDALHHVGPLVHRRHSLTLLANSCAAHEALQHAPHSGNSTPRGGPAAAAGSGAGWGLADAAAEPACDQEHLLPQGSMRSSDRASSHPAHARSASSGSSTRHAHSSLAGTVMWRHSVQAPTRQGQHHNPAPLATTISRSSSSRWSRWRKATRGVRSSLGQLFGPQLRRTTLRMIIAWLAAAFAYYGLVQLVTQLHMGQGGSGRGCSQGRVQVSGNACCAPDEQHMPGSGWSVAVGRKT